MFTWPTLLPLVFLVWMRSHLSFSTCASFALPLPFYVSSAAFLLLPQASSSNTNRSHPVVWFWTQKSPRFIQRRLSIGNRLVLSNAYTNTSSESIVLLYCVVAMQRKDCKFKSATNCSPWSAATCNLKGYGVAKVKLLIF